MRRLLPAVVGLALCAIGIPSALAATAPSTSPSPTASPTPAPTDPLQQQIQAALQQQAALKATKDALAGTISAANDAQSNLRGLVEANRKTITDTLAQLSQAEQRYSEATGRAAQAASDAEMARRHEEEDKALLAGFIRDEYMNEDSFAAYMLSADSFSELFSRAAIVTHLADTGSNLLVKIKQDRVDAESAEALAQTEAQAAAQAAADLVARKADLEKQTADEQSLISQLQAQSQAAATEIQNADQQTLELAQKIADLRIQQLDDTIAAAEKAAWDEAEYYLQNHLLGLPAGQAFDPTHPPSADVRFIWPVPGSILSQPYGPSQYTFEPPYQGFPHFHTGEDLAAPMDTPVLAAGDGVVVAATTSDVGYGNHVIIAHDGHTLTLYGHLDQMLVKPGDTVRQGQPIGLMGSTGNSTGPHCHFEVRIDDNPVDPTLFLPPLPPGATGPPAQH